MRNFSSWINCKNTISYFNNKNVSFIIGPGTQKYIVKQSKLDYIEEKMNKLSPYFVSQHYIDKKTENIVKIYDVDYIDTQEMENLENSKLIIKNDKNFKKWIYSNLVYEKKDLIDNCFLELIFKLPSKSIQSYQNNNIIDIYKNIHRNNEPSSFGIDSYFYHDQPLLEKYNGKIKYNGLYSNLRENYNDDKTLLISPKNNINEKYEEYILHSSIMCGCIFVGFEYMLKDPIVNKIVYNHLYNHIKKDKKHFHNYILVKEKDSKYINVNNNIFEILLYPNYLNINDVFNYIHEQIKLLNNN